MTLKIEIPEGLAIDEQEVLMLIAGRLYVKVNCRWEKLLNLQDIPK